MQELDSVAHAFSRAACVYEQVATVQHQVAAALRELLSAHIAHLPMGNVIDAGAGTGLETLALQQLLQREVLAIDIAPGMLQQAQARGLTTLQADIARLPLLPASVALAHSAYALQWCQPEPVLQSLRQALCAQGLLVFSVPLDGTLAELQQAQQQAGLPSTVNTFYSAAEWCHWLQQAGFVVFEQQSLTHVQALADVPSLLRLLHDMGASTSLQSPHASGLSGRARLRALAAAYEAQRSAEGLPVSWVSGLFVAQGCSD